jgi:23S rRNA pseudouridine2605 synthase
VSHDGGPAERDGHTSPEGDRRHDEPRGPLGDLPASRPAGDARPAPGAGEPAPHGDAPKETSAESPGRPDGQAASGERGAQRRGGRGGRRGGRGGRGGGERSGGEQRGERASGAELGERSGGERGGGERGERGSERGSGEQRGDMTLVVYLARGGVGSRRRCDELIREGKVTIDGTVITFPREKVADKAEVALEGEVVTLREYRYLLINKPRGVASTRRDPHAERVIVDLVPDGRVLFPVGRLDVDTTGLIILTNDGVLANRLMHPRYGVTKTYSARVHGHATKRALAELRAGIELEDGRTAPAEARIEKQSNKTTLLELTIHEGRKHQVRRMLAALGLPVEELHRRRYGPLSDKNLKIGAWRALSGDEIEALRRASEEVERNLLGDDPGSAVDLAASVAAPFERETPDDDAASLGDSPFSASPRREPTNAPEPRGPDERAHLDRAEPAGDDDAPAPSTEAPAQEPEEAPAPSTEAPAREPEEAPAPSTEAPAHEPEEAPAPSTEAPAHEPEGAPAREPDEAPAHAGAAPEAPSAREPDEAPAHDGAAEGDEPTPQP